MSKIANKPVAVPSGVTVKAGQGVVAVKGPKGELKRALPAGIDVKVGKDALNVVIPENAPKQLRISQGSIRAHIGNMVQGVQAAFTKTLLLEGVGFRAQATKDGLTMTLGFSHPVLYKLPAGVKAETPEPTKVIITGLDRELVGKTAAEIRGLKKPEPYKGKGFRYETERIRRKAGKAIVK